MIKKILLSLAVLVIAAAAVGLMLPRHARVARSVPIETLRTEVYAPIK